MAPWSQLIWAKWRYVYVNQFINLQSKAKRFSLFARLIECLQPRKKPFVSLCIVQMFNCQIFKIFGKPIIKWSYNFQWIFKFLFIKLNGAQRRRGMVKITRAYEACTRVRSMLHLKRHKICKGEGDGRGQVGNMLLEEGIKAVSGRVMIGWTDHFHGVS